METEEKKEFVLTDENYHSPEARKHYLGSSMFKEFLKCEVMGLAKVNGEFEDKSSTALLVGSYVDAYFSGELDQFIVNHPEIFTKQGTLKADYQKAEEVIKVIEADEVLMKYLSGNHQKIMTGTIAGVPFKIKMDSYHPGKVIVDQKVIQGAIYREIESQNSEDNKPLPFVLAVTTKEDVPDKELFEIDPEYLDNALELVKTKAPRFWDIIQGKIAPVGCGHCPACRKIKKLTGVMSYGRLFKETE